MDSTELSIERRIYGLWDVCGDVGGVIEVLWVVAGLFLQPISLLVYKIKAITELYNVKSTDQSLYKKGKIYFSVI